MVDRARKKSAHSVSVHAGWRAYGGLVRRLAAPGMASQTAALTLAAVHRDVEKTSEFTDYVRVKIRMWARTNRRPWMLVRVIPCPTVNMFEVHVSAAAVINRVLHDLAAEGYRVAHVGDGVVLVDWTPAFEQAMQQAPRVLDRVRATASVDVEVDRAQQRSQIAELMRRAASRRVRYA